MSKLACHIFMDIGRIYETPRSETEDSSLLSARIEAKVSPFPYGGIPSPNFNRMT